MNRRTMIQCISDSNPHDDVPDWLEIAEQWLKDYQRMSGRNATQDENELYAMVEGLANYISEEL